ncbi:MAG: hypothetical protein GQ527_01955, partial [Bacteroidales bacterium]|nr:hypothetical protein [Bacteroidales bacterium]
MKYTSVFLIILFSFKLFGQEASLECLTVQEDDGAVSLRFSGPTSTSSFNIHRSNQLNGLYELIHSTTNGVFNNYLDIDINASSQSYSYYVEAIKNGVGTGASNKLRTILLNIN